jgi:hypothetical protein
VNRTLVDRIVNAVLYEGYVLYPYRASAIKNQKRWMFGGLYPPAWSAAQNGTDSASMQTECLVSGDDSTCLDVEIRFLHLLARGEGDDERQEATERQVTIGRIKLAEIESPPKRIAFTFPASRESEGGVERTQEFIQGAVEVQSERTAPQLWKVTIRSSNETPLEHLNAPSALMRSMASTHALLDVRGGQFISLLTPPEDLREIAAGCRNIGVWPVLVGQNAERDTMLASPIILYDYPQVAPESAGDFFDATEMDEMLTLRVMTLTDDEKSEMRAGDERARRILERTESLAPEHLMKLHGAIRGLRPAGGS